MMDLSNKSQEELQRLAAILEEQALAYQSKSLDQYKPHENGPDGGQLAFHKSNHKIRLMITGNRFGKSTCSVIEAIWLCLGIHPYHPMPVPVRGKLYADSFPMVMENLKLKLDEWLPRESLDSDKPYIYNQQGMLIGVNFKNGSLLKIGSYDQDTRKAEGSNWHFCVEGDQEVMMWDGSYKKIKDIRAGDKVVSLAKNFRRKIGEVWETYKSDEKKELYSIKTVGGNEIKCTGDHLIWEHRKGWKKAEDLKVGEYLYRPILAGYSVESTLTKNDGFIIGAMIGDGWTTEKSPMFACANDEVLQYLFSCLPIGHSIKHKQRYDYRIGAKGLISNHVKDILLAHGLWGKKSHEKFIPDEIFRSSDNVRIECLKGLYCTDGWVTKTAVGYGSTSKKLAKDVKKLLDSFGIKSGIYFKKKQDEKWRDQWFVIVSNSINRIRFYNLIKKIPGKNEALKKMFYYCSEVSKKSSEMAVKKFGNKVNLSSKNRKNRTNERFHHQRSRITSIQKIGKDYVYDIKVEKYHNFICEGFKIHNCGYDEPPPRDLYVANLRGLVDFDGIMWIAATPLSEAWMFDDLWQPGVKGEKKHIKCIRGTGHDNPHIDKGGLHIFLEELTPQEREIRELGHFAKLTGLVIDTYDPNLSDIDPFDLTEEYSIYEGIDPHPAKPHAALWKAIDPEGRRFVVGELYIDATIRDFADAVHHKRQELQAHGATLVRSICDTSLNQKDPNMRVNLKQEFCDQLKRWGERVMPVNAQKRDWLLPGIQKLKDLYRPVRELDENMEPIGDLAPTQFVFKTCEHYRHELTHYQWPENSFKDNVIPVQKWDDLLDCDRYIESVNPRHRTPGEKAFMYTKSRGAYQRLSREDVYSL